jgi:hypothetical protein
MAGITLNVPRYHPFVDVGKWRPEVDIEAIVAAGRVDEKKRITSQDVLKKKKWANVEKDTRPEHQFLHFRGKKEDYEDHVQNTSYNNGPDAVGTNGSPPNVTFDLLKKFAAYGRHPHLDSGGKVLKPELANKNFLILPSIFGKAAPLRTEKEMTRFFKQYTHRVRMRSGTVKGTWHAYRWKAPWEYDKILIQGSMLQPDRFGRDTPHAVLLVIYFDRSVKPPNIEIVSYNVGPHTTADDPELIQAMEGIEQWLRSYHTAHCPGSCEFSKITIRESMVQPEQHDGWNCGEYMYTFAKVIIKEAFLTKRRFRI